MKHSWSSMLSSQYEHRNFWMVIQCYWKLIVHLQPESTENYSDSVFDLLNFQICTVQANQDLCAAPMFVQTSTHTQHKIIYLNLNVKSVTRFSLPHKRLKFEHFCRFVIVSSVFMWRNILYDLPETRSWFSNQERFIIILRCMQV